MSEPNVDRGALWRNANFRWLCGGGAISMLGDQFTLIALPWLVLRLTHDPLALGGVVAAMNAPRALFMLVGGALVDRASPRAILLLTKFACAALLGLLGALVLTRHVDMALVYVLAAAIGLSTAFAYPAGSALLPGVMPPALLAPANAVIMGMRQITMLAGPLAAGLLFALADRHDRHDARGLALAFGFDCLTFAISAWTLSKVMPQPDVPAPAQPVLRAVQDSLVTAWRDTLLRTCLLYWAIGACIVGGTMQVALPVLASERLHGAASLSLLLGAHGAGALVGMVASGSVGKRAVGRLGATLLVVDGLVGLLLVPLGRVDALWQGLLLALLIGVLGGFVQVAMFTWIQQRVAPAMLGRMMSLFMFIFMGLPPLAALLAGWLAGHVALPALFGGAGLSLAAVALVAWLCSPLRTLRAATWSRDGLA